MVKKSWQRAFSFLLTLAMLLSLLVVPAAAADLRTKWDYRNWDKDTTWADDEKVQVQGATATVSGLEIDATASGAKYDARNAGANWIQVNKDTVIKIPVEVPVGQVAVLTAEFFGANQFEVDGVANTAGGGKKDADTFTCTGAGGYITVKAIANGYIGYLAVSYKEGEVRPSVSLSEKTLRLKVGEADGQVTATVNNGTASRVYVVSKDTGIATATVAEGKVAVHPVAQGATTVDVAAEFADGYVAVETIAVTVLPAGEVVYDNWDFTASDWTAAEKVAIQGNTGTLRGLEIDATASGAKFSGNQLGSSWVQFNKDTIVKVPVQVPEGKMALVTVAAYATNTISVDGVPNTEKTQQFVCAGTDGWVVIKGLGGQGYLASIKVEYGEGELAPILEIDKDYLGLQLGKTESGEIAVTVTNSTAAVKAVSADTSIATAAVDGKKVTITAAGAGSTTVDISLDGVAESELTKKTVKVDVDAAGAVHYIAEGVYNFANYTPDNIGSIKGLDTHGAVPQVASVSHGLQEPGAGAGTSGTATGTIQLTVNIPEGRTADISFVTCRYGIGTALEMTASSGTVSKEETAVDSATGLKFSVAGASGEATFTFKVPDGKDSDGNDYNKGIWIHTMDVLFGAVMETNRQIDVWDLTGQVATGEGIRNNVAPEAWKGHAVNGALSGGTDFTVGDFSLIHNANDRLYSSVENADSFGAQAPGYGKWEYEDGYVPNGGIYCNGTGGEGNRFMLVKNVFPGDKLVIYAGSAKDTVAYYVKGQGAAAEQSQEYPGVDVNTYAKMEFVAEHAGAYKIWGAPGKPMYQRVVRYPGVPVTGTITLPAEYNGPAEYGIKFVNNTTKAATVVEVKNNQFTATLAPGHEYNAIMTGAPGWGFTLSTKKLTTAIDGGVGETPGMTHDMSVEVKATYTYSGAIAGFAEGYDLTDLAIDVLPEEGSGSDETFLTIDKTAKTFTAVLDPEVEYTLVLKGVDDYVIKTPLTVKSEKDDLTGQTLSVEPKATYTASGKFLGLGADGRVTALSFVYLKADGKPDAKYTYPAAVTADGYTAKLRDGAYEVKATVEGKYATKTHVVVEGKDAVKDLMFVFSAEKPAVDKVKDVYVGYAGKTPNFETVRDAVDAVSRMGITAEADRVTVHIAPGTYREQIMVTTPYVTFKNDEPAKGEVLLTWYYGIGYKYFSSGSPAEGGYYNPERAYDKFEKNIADRWGTAVRVTGKGFRAENITFENSFNRYITEEEILDGAEPAGNEAINLARNYNLDVTTKAATERAAAICVEADECEFYKCKFYSSQDTVYTQGKVYFKSCLIEGQTDYIFGDVASKCIFDGCQLSWKGYKNGNQGGYITALRSNKGDVGYLFRNCAVTANPKLTVTAGGFGRPWGADANVFFLNTKLANAGLITDEGWTDMSGNKPENAQFGEFGTTLMDGAAVDTSKRVTGTVKTQAEANAINDMTKYYGSWVPFYYVEEAATVAFETDPYITDNGDINIPYPGHTLTANYSLGAANDANDASVIKWYAVKDGAETLLKTSVATVDKTYQIAKTDIGANIKVEVIPTTLSGKTGEAKTATVVESVKDGYDDPSGVTDPDLGAGVNIFLAGDSTVKDYGASGMYQGGKPSNEGSWGEFLQNYFNSDLVTVVNYANGGRSTRNFLNEGSLDKIAQNIKEGDYLLIQFGHNDCANDKAYREDRYVPLGTPDANGVYPVTPGVKNDKGVYTWDCGGTYKWFLQQYIDVAKNAGATPVLVTPVARMYYGSDGSINPHHDASLVPGTETTTETKNDKKSNTYCEAVRQLAKEQNVLLIDGYALTEQMFVDAYKAGGNSTFGQQTMTSGDSTHSNKLGGMIEAGLIAQSVQNMGLNISKTVKAPAKTMGESPKGETVFIVDGAGKFTAYDMLSKPDAYTAEATYWMGMGQKLFDAIAAKAEEFKPDEPGKTDKTELTKAVAAAEAVYAVGDDVEVKPADTKASAVEKGQKFVTADKLEGLAKAIASAKAVLDDKDATEADVTKALADLKAAQDAFKVLTGTKSSGGSSSSGSRPSSRPTETEKKDENGNTAKKTTDGRGNTVITVTAPNGETIAKVTLPATIPSVGYKFIDVPDDHWAAKSINDLAGLNMVKGVDDVNHVYDMKSATSRGAVATILFRLSSGKAGIGADFTDVADSAWYADAVAWAAKYGVVTGNGDGTFAPEKAVTREQLALMLYRYAKLLGMDVKATGNLDGFTDAASVSTWASDAMTWAVGAGIIKGTDTKALDPTGAATRAETACMIDRFVGLAK